MATLAEKQAELAQAKTDLANARLILSYGQGDRTVNRERVDVLQAQVALLSREVAELEAAANGALNPFVITASFNR
ncbi:MAG: hypothetical protein D6744_02825 [Planctomycetota bacterium]|nr:MAG: hypothetical protein D6744_02825 [Planctomycetota bacterium]